MKENYTLSNWQNISLSMLHEKIDIVKVKIIKNNTEVLFSQKGKTIQKNLSYVANYIRKIFITGQKNNHPNLISDFSLFIFI